jgi:hypothetical protein
MRLDSCEEREKKKVGTGEDRDGFSLVRLIN